MISAQETTPGQASSTAALAVSIRSIPCSVRLGTASNSALLVAVLLIRFDASHPCNKHDHSIRARRLISHSELHAVLQEPRVYAAVTVHQILRLVNGNARVSVAAAAILVPEQSSRERRYEGDQR